MEAALTWVCSFAADKARVWQQTRTVTCGERLLLCSIQLTNSTSKFTNYHENKIAISYRRNNTEVAGRDCTFQIEEASFRQLKVYCVCRRAGKAIVKLDLGKWYIIEDQNICIDILPSSPEGLRDVQVVHCEKFKDEEDRPKLRHTSHSAFYGIKSCLGFEVVDRFGNIIQQLMQYEMTVRHCDNIRSDPLEWEMKNGIVTSFFLPKQIGENQMIVRIVGKGLNSKNGSSYVFEIPVDIHYPACSRSRTLRYVDGVRKQCIAGEECTFEVTIYDVFGRPVHPDSEDICDINAQIICSETESRGQRQEQVKTRKIEVPECRFDVAVGFKKTGLRKVRLRATCRSKTSYRDIDVKVFPSFPYRLNHVSFTTNGAVDESFSADLTVMYRNQWSILEATLVDSFDNVVGEQSIDYDISFVLTSDTEEEMKAEYKDAKIQNEKLRVLVKINQAGKHNLSITLAKKSDPLEVVRLEDVVIKVNDAPLYLAGSKIHYPKFCVAGTRIQLQIHPFDVFGCPLPANSTSCCSPTDSPVKLSGNEEANEAIDFEVIKKKSGMVIRFSVLLTKSGRRRLVMTDRNGGESMERRTHSQYKEIYVGVAPSSPKRITNVEVSRSQEPVDRRQRLKETGTLYYRVESLLKFEVVDGYGNLIEEIKDEKNYDVTIEYCGNDVVHRLEWEMRGGKIFANFSPEQIGENQMIIRMVDTRLAGKEESSCTYQMLVDVLCPLCSPFLTLENLTDIPVQCTAGESCVFQVKLYDVFGKPVHPDSKDTCDITAQISPLKTVLERHQEPVNVKKIDIPECIRFDVTVCFKKAGRREVKLILNPGSVQLSRCKDVDVEVFPSTPRYLKHVKYTTNGAVDENFCADSKVMYRNQWSTIEATLVDSYDNPAREQSNRYKIGLELTNDGAEEVAIEYKDAKIKNENFQVQVKIDEAGECNLSITLKNRSNPREVVHLEEIQVKVGDAPLYFAGSEFPVLKPCVVGEQITLQMTLLDVFGCPLTADSVHDCNLKCEISDLDEDNEAMNFELVRHKSNVVFYIFLSLTKAGRRELVIYDEDGSSKKLSMLVNPDLNDVHWELIAVKKTAFRRERLISTIGLFDRFGNDVSSLSDSSNVPELVRQNGPDALQIARKSMECDKSTIHFSLNKTGKYELCLSDEDGEILPGTSFSITVQDAPLDGRRSSVNWIPEYEDMDDQPVFPEDKSFRCRLRLKDAADCDYDTKIQHDCIKVKYHNTEVKNVKVSSSAYKSGTYEIVVPLKNLAKDDLNPEFWCFVNGVKIEKPLDLPTFEVFEKYDDDNNCVTEFLTIFCYGVTRKDIIGEDYCHLNNIKRVCDMYEDPEVEENIDDEIDVYGDGTKESKQENNDICDDDYDDSCDDDYYDNDTNGAENLDDYDGDDYGNGDDYSNDEDCDVERCTVIELPIDEILHEVENNNFVNIASLDQIKNVVQKFRDILLHLLRAIRYRNEAFDLDTYREDWKERAKRNYKRIEDGECIDKNRPRFCSQIKENYAKLMRKYHNEACEEFFQFFNAERGQSEIDLHGLLVVDEKKLREYERQLCFRGRMSLIEIGRKINEERDHGNEAIRKLSERIHKYDMKKAKEDGEPWLEIIVGSGHHSKVKERQRIRPKVEEFLKNREGKYANFKPVNKGALVVTFEPYAGRQPCYGEYYCTKCDNRWRNGRSWIGKWQGCYDCYEESGLVIKCYPLKQRSWRKHQFYHHKTASINRKPTPEHLEELCAKCIELKHPCPQVTWTWCMDDYS
ncbi:uncharacterized protein LOC114534526 [Dendronephthya gigantea]|uniref:uncharacterized protein LOC114534526 n=1 Tax=Dendronephthya gigantea TaxID=151771 RepID=UPI00106CD277|nr:uncharacterized protein LOC114534526 [Dendronephthya gigantea]